MWSFIGVCHVQEQQNYRSTLQVSKPNEALLKAHSCGLSFPDKFFPILKFITKFEKPSNNSSQSCLQFAGEKVCSFSCTTEQILAPQAC